MSQAQHAQQAAELARAEGHPPHVLVGALLHDIGNLQMMMAIQSSILLIYFQQMANDANVPLCYEKV